MEFVEKLLQLLGLEMAISPLEIVIPIRTKKLFYAITTDLIKKNPL